jgi:hypothetical protein
VYAALTLDAPMLCPPKPEPVWQPPQYILNSG